MHSSAHTPTHPHTQPLHTHLRSAEHDEDGRAHDKQDIEDGVFKRVQRLAPGLINFLQFPAARGGLDWRCIASPPQHARAFAPAQAHAGSAAHHCFLGWSASSHERGSGAAPVGQLRAMQAGSETPESCADPASSHAHTHACTHARRRIPGERVEGPSEHGALLLLVLVPVVALALNAHHSRLRSLGCPQLFPHGGERVIVFPVSEGGRLLEPVPSVWNLPRTARKELGERHPTVASPLTSATPPTAATPVPHAIATNR